jgi:hypothetical protein
MPNTKNFESNPSSYYGPKFTMSRIIANLKDSLLDMEVPADFKERLLENNIEIALYSLADNSLLFSDVIKNTNKVFKVETLQYEDNTFRKLLFIDFAKVSTLAIPPGRYSITLNFFQNEIGDYFDRPLKVTKISTSNTEVELKLTDVELQDELSMFAIPRINVEYIHPVLLQIFNQSGSADLRIPTSPARIDSSSIYQNFSSGSGELFLKYNFDDDNNEFLGINTIAQNVLDLAYPIVVETIDSKILSGSTSFTEDELINYVVSALDTVYDYALKDEEDNPQRYRFDLI